MVNTSPKKPKTKVKKRHSLFVKHTGVKSEEKNESIIKEENKEEK